MGSGRNALQLATLAAGCVPLLLLLARAARGDLGANPIEEITHATGGWALGFLLISLAVTPARKLTGLARLAPLRRTVGLIAFAYACLHFLTWLALDQFFDWRAMWEDVQERRFITAGFAALLCLLPLAATSTRGWMRRLGRRWLQLHRLAYAAATLGVLHFIWLVKADLLEPLLFAAALAVLLGIRAWGGLSRHRAFTGKAQAR